MNRAMIAFGLLTLIVGVGIGHLMVTHPEGLNPAWPLWMALLVPAVFVLSGLHVIAVGLRQPQLSVFMLRAILFCFFAIVNWAAFFTTHIQCRVVVSFLGSALFGWYPEEAACRDSLRLIVAAIDMIIVGAVAVFAWQRSRAPRAKLAPDSGSDDRVGA